VESWSWGVGTQLRGNSNSTIAERSRSKRQKERGAAEQRRCRGKNNNPTTRFARMVNATRKRYYLGTQRSSDGRSIALLLIDVERVDLNALV